MLIIYRARLGFHSQEGGSAPPHRQNNGIRMATKKARDLRLVSVWHGQQGDTTIHFSLYNNGPGRLTDFTLCLTGTLWLAQPTNVRGGSVVTVVSNFVEIRPDAPAIEPDDVWSFSLAPLSNWPRHAGDGAQSAYIAFADGGFAAVAVQPLARSHDASQLYARPQAVPEPLIPVVPPSQMTISVIPFPNVASIAVAPLTSGAAALQTAGNMSAAQVKLCDTVAALAGRVVPGRHAIFAKPGETGLRHLSLRSVHDARLGAEGYKIIFDGLDIYVDAEAEAGFLYGLITLAQMVVGAREMPHQFGFPVRGAIADVPRFGWRGVLVDVARTFYSMNELRALVDLFAWLKLNLLHLHLNDDEGWRINVNGYPEVAKRVALRGHGLLVPPLLGSSFEPYGGVYSPTDISALESHSAALSLRLMPEIDVPGHAHALLEALPELREPGDTGGYNSIQGFFGNALNPCLPQTYDFLGATFDTVMKTFRGPLVHIGGDEVVAATWSHSPAAKKAATEKGLTSTGELQRAILEWVRDRLAKSDRTVVAWEDALNHAELDPAGTIAVVWQHPDRAHERALRGYDVVLAPANAYYLDMALTDDWQASGGHWAGVVPLQQTYDFEADLGWPVELLGQLRGVHACIWGEYMHDRRNFDALVFPRIFAFAERAWIERSAKDYAGFLARAKACTARIDRSEGRSL
jgi:hexosaminidase